jgi:subtilisin family serine protease
MNVFATETTRYDDPYVELQAAALDMELEQAHRVATGRGVLIAVIDSAVDADHPDLRGRVRVERDFVTGRPARHAELHGTAIAGIIASAVNNRLGIIGVAPDSGIAALRACWAVDDDRLEAQCSTFSLAQALQTALDVGADVVNLSLAGPADPLLERLLDEAIARGVIVIAAEPVTARAERSFPASHPRVIAAQSAATAIADLPFRLGAPAAEILTTTPGATYAFLSGNSLAAAHASGAVALLLEHEPSVDAERAQAVLAATSKRSPGKTSINACRALEALRGPAFCDPRDGEALADF